MAAPYVSVSLTLVFPYQVIFLFRKNRVLNPALMPNWVTRLGFFTPMPTPYLELHLHTPYSFLDGGSHMEALVRRAAELGMPSLAMTDHDNVAGAVKFVTLCHAYGIKPVLGAELTMEDGSHLTLLAQNRQGYAHLCTLISKGYAHGGRLTPGLPWDKFP